MHLNHQKISEFLYDIQKKDKEIDALIEQKKSYLDLATKVTTAIGSERVQSSYECNDKMADIVTRIVDIENEILLKIDTLIDYKEAAIKVIKRLDDIEDQRVLILRHISYLNMYEVAKKMNIDRRTAYRKYNKAVNNLQKILSDSDKK